MHLCTELAISCFWNATVLCASQVYFSRIYIAIYDLIAIYDNKCYYKQTMFLMRLQDAWKYFTMQLYLYIAQKFLISLKLLSKILSNFFLQQGHCLPLCEKCLNIKLFLVRIFPYSDWIQRKWETQIRKNSVFKLLFTQCAGQGIGHRQRHIKNSVGDLR